MTAPSLITLPSQCDGKVAVRRITAPNPGPMTGNGTNSYIVGNDRLAVIDPGPAISSHIDALVDVCEGRLDNILVTHTHQDHSPAACQLAEKTGARLIGMPLKPDDGHQDVSFKPSIVPQTEQLLPIANFSLKAVFTPGHVGNHFCYYLEEERMMFAGDHVMNGSTVVIIPPSGCMKDYIDSLERMKDYQPAVIAPAHGELIFDAVDELDYLIGHRLKREEKIFHALAKSGKISLSALVPLAYDDVDPMLHKVAIYSLLAHLLKLEADERVVKTIKEHGAFGEELWGVASQ